MARLLVRDKSGTVGSVALKHCPNCGSENFSSYASSNDDMVGISHNGCVCMVCHDCRFELPAKGYLPWREAVDQWNSGTFQPALRLEL